MVGGVCVNTGTIPSKTLREAVVYLTGMSLREVYGASYRVKSDITIADLDQRTHQVIAREVDVIRDQLLRNHVDLVSGTARFVDANTLGVQLDTGDERQVSAERIVVAVGTKPTRPAGVWHSPIWINPRRNVPVVSTAAPQASSRPSARRTPVTAPC